MGRFLEAVRLRGLLAGDGGMGSALLARGLTPGEAPERWNLTRPGDVEAVHRSFVDAGAEVLETNTFGGSRVVLERYGLGEKVAEVASAAVAAARRAAGAAGVLVAGSMGPSGKLLQPYGDATEVELAGSFAEQAAALAEAGADLLVVETMTSLAEARLAVSAARSTGLDVVATMTFNETRRGPFTIMGEAPAACAAGLLEAGACAVGCNCGVGTVSILRVLEAFRASTVAPLAAWPNAGLPRTVDGRTVYDEAPEAFATFVRGAAALGAVWLGGCCGSAPAHVAAVRSAVDDRRRETGRPA